MRTGIIRDALAIVHPLDVHFTATVGAVEKSRQRRGLAPAIRVTLDIGADALHIVKCLLIDNSLMGILKNCPFAFIDIVTFLVLKMLLCLEIDRMSQVFPLFEDMDNNGRSPAVGVFDGFVFVHALSVPGKMDGGDFDFVSGQPGGDLIRAVPLQRHGKDTPDYGGGFFIHQPVLPLLVPQVAVDCCAGQVLTAHTLGLEH